MMIKDVIASVCLVGVLLFCGCSSTTDAVDESSTEDSHSAVSSEPTSRNDDSNSETTDANEASDVTDESEEVDFESLALSFDAAALDLGYTNRDTDPTYDDATAVHIELNGSTASAEGTGANGVDIDESVVTITKEGTYVIAGTLDDGQIVVDIDSEEKVQVVLDNAEIHNETGPAFYVLNADKCFLTLAEGSVNILSDGSEYKLEEDSDEPYATVFSHDDLTINGQGMLQVVASYRHAICSKDDLVITGGSYVIDAAEDGIRGRDCVKINSGVFMIDAGKDGIKSNNDTSATRGFVSIDGGDFVINAADDGIQAAMYVRIAGGDISIISEDDAFHSDVEMLLEGGSISVDAGDDAFHAETVLSVDGGTINITGCYEGLEAQEIYINDGTTHITASDDGINATTADLSGSDAADFWDWLSNPRDNERRENGGAPDNSMTEPGTGGIMGDDNCFCQINGGYTVVNANGDGLDCNGSIEITGGVLLVDGPTSNADGALDYDLQATISGGTVIMTGSTGMAQSFTSGSSQPFSYVTLNGDAGDSIAVVDMNSAKLLGSFTPSKRYSMVIVSSPDFKEGSDYSFILGGTVSGANEDGYATGSHSVSGGSQETITASTTATRGYGGLDMNGNPKDPGQGGDVQNERRNDFFRGNPR